MLVLTLILLSLFVLFFLYRNNDTYNIEVYDLNNLYDNSENAPRIIPFKKYKGSLNSVTNNKNNGLYFQCRQHFNKILNEKYGHLIDNVLTDMNLPNNETRVFRMGSTPHRILAHFDSLDRYIVMVDGYKDILTFRLDHYSGQEQIDFLHAVKNMRMNGLQNELKRRSVKYSYDKINSGDVFHIEPGLYHYIENDTMGGYTTCLNIDYEINTKYENLWNYMWKNGGDWSV